MSYKEEGYLEHYGTPRHSGRYPWGSGKDPYQRDVSFRKKISEMRSIGMTDTQIAKSMNMNTSELRKRISMAKSGTKRYESQEAVRLYDKGYSKSAIAKRMGTSVSAVSLLLDPTMQKRRDLNRVNADILKEAVAEKGYIDIGKGTEQLMGITSTRLKNAVKYLEDEGYVVYNNIYFAQLGTNNDTTLKVLCPPGTTKEEVIRNKDKISLVYDYYSEDGGNTMRKKEPPVSIDPSRVAIRYAEDGGTKKDGVIELRRGVEDLSLGRARYAQVRIAVGGTHYLKGMAVYSDNIPEGADIVFNTNKKRGTMMMNPDPDGSSVLKPMKNDPDNPFGAVTLAPEKMIRCQSHYIGKDGKEHLSALNIVREEGNWATWSKNLSSQFLGKQNPKLAKRQLDLSYSIAKSEFDEIMNLTNPVLRSKLLDEFAGKCDSDAAALKAAALPRQSTKVLLPVPGLKEGDVYAPDYRDGEKVALVRYPHGAIFEIPELTVNKRNPEAKKIVGNSIDAIGIHPKVAEILSGADFDGDYVVVIPTSKVKIKNADRPDELKDFDPKEKYPYYDGKHVMTSREKGIEMGEVSNLITDMTIKGAPMDDIVRAVKHSMVVIDAEKHRLDYKRSEIEQGIPELKEMYQGGAKRGASTLLSRSEAKAYVDHRKKIVSTSKMTPEQLKAWNEGKEVYEPTGKTYTKKRKKDGEVVLDKDGNPIYDTKDRKTELARMDTVDDAYDLIEGGREGATLIESIYADYANDMKALANRCRRESRTAGTYKYEPSAAKTYEKEVRELTAALNIAKRNSPFERQAQLLATLNFRTKLRNNPGLDAEHIKRLKGQELDYARRMVNAKKIPIKITEKQWEAINAGAISASRFKEILDNCDIDIVKNLATPRASTAMSPAKVSKAKSLLANGYTQADVADLLGVSVSTLMKAVE